MKYLIMIFLSLFLIGCSQNLRFNLQNNEDALIHQPVNKEFLNISKTLIKSCTTKAKIKCMPQFDSYSIIMEIDETIYLFKLDSRLEKLKQIKIYSSSKEGSFLHENYSNGYDEFISFINNKASGSF